MEPDTDTEEGPREPRAEDPEADTSSRHVVEMRESTWISPDIRAILVPLDGSSLSELALREALRLSARIGAEAFLLSAVANDDEIKPRATRLAAISTRVRVAHWDVVVAPDPAEAIHTTLSHLQPAVACLASHGRGRSAALLGSVANDVVTQGHECLVLAGRLLDEEAAVMASSSVSTRAPHQERSSPSLSVGPSD